MTTRNRELLTALLIKSPALSTSSSLVFLPHWFHRRLSYPRLLLLMRLMPMPVNSAKKIQRRTIDKRQGASLIGDPWLPPQLTLGQWQSGQEHGIVVTAWALLSGTIMQTMNAINDVVVQSIAHNYSERAAIALCAEQFSSCFPKFPSAPELPRKLHGFGVGLWFE